jgi:hypothetical protein
MFGRPVITDHADQLDRAEIAGGERAEDGGAAKHVFAGGSGGFDAVKRHGADNQDGHRRYPLRQSKRVKKGRLPFFNADGAR